jgi:hypothetical protein
VVVIGLVTLVSVEASLSKVVIALQHGLFYELQE